MYKFCYFPILKTTEAELKAYDNLDESVKLEILPVFELTKSRISKNNPHGILAKKLEKLSKVIKRRPVIFDLTTEPTYSNIEIEKMIYNASDGYREWITFLKNEKEKFTIIPTVHYNPYKKKDVRYQVDQLRKYFSCVAFRVEVFQQNSDTYVQDFFSFCRDTGYKKTILVLDGKYFREDNKNNLFKKEVLKLTKNITSGNHHVVCAFSSFPKSPKSFGEDSHGSIKMLESETNQRIILNSNNGNNNIYHGDYASIHPVRYNTGGGGWIPRIDVPLNDKCIYRRYRRDDGSYIRCAKEIINNEESYKKIEDIPTWGDEEIQYAYEGNPRGKHPSHWIAVRSNLYMTKQYLRLRQVNRYLSLSL